MANGADVHSLRALEDYRGSWLDFGKKGLAAIESVLGEIRRTEQWLQRQLTNWKMQIRKCEDEVFIAKQELSQRKMMRFHDRKPDTIEQEKALRLAQARLAYSQNKERVTKRWLRDLAQEMIEFEGPIRLLRTFLESDVPRGGALLKDKLETLEAYLATKLPSSERKHS